MKSTPLFLGISALLLIAEGSPLAAAIFAWLGGIQILNFAAARFPFAPSIHWLHAMTFEPLALLGVAVMRLAPFWEKGSGKGQPILLIHGYMNHSSVWTLQKKRLEALGFGPIYGIDLGHPFQSIRRYAEKVREKAKAIAEQTGRKDLILIGHSMGGLVGCWYATQLASPHTVTDVITIGTPLVGTPLARIGLGLSAREMEPNSDLIRQLQLAMAQDKEIRFHHIATKRDQFVIPGISALITDNKHFILEDIGHASLLYSRRVTAKVVEWLRGKV